MSREKRWSLPWILFFVGLLPGLLRAQTPSPDQSSTAQPGANSAQPPNLQAISQTGLLPVFAVDIGEKLGTGHAKVAPDAAMSAGEYAAALRPVDKSHKFSSEEVGKNGSVVTNHICWTMDLQSANPKSRENKNWEHQLPLLVDGE